MSTTTTTTTTSSLPATLTIAPLPPFKPDLYQRAWSSTPHPTLPLLATAHAKSVTVFSLSTLTKHSALTGGHARSVRCAAWKPGLAPHKLCLVTGSFDATAGLWRWENKGRDVGSDSGLAVEITAGDKGASRWGEEEEEEPDEDDWEFTLVLEGHENEVKCAAFSPSGQYLATSSRDKSVWIWEDVGATEADDEWETVAVLTEHDGDVKAVAWCPDVRGSSTAGRSRNYSSDVLASASYDNTVRVWREDSDGEWVCVAVLEGHEGTVWGVQWEGRPREDGRFPRLLTWSADRTVRIWTLKEEEEDEQPGGGATPWSGLGIPNTMRKSQREEWACTAILPSVHTRDVYSASWSATSGLVASTGSDGVIAVYGEGNSEPVGEKDEDVQMASSPAADQEVVEESAPTDGDAAQTANGSTGATNGTTSQSTTQWKILATVSQGHGPYEINHVTWCKRFDPGTEKKGTEEMLVTTGDDGVVRPWQLIMS